MCSAVFTIDESERPVENEVARLRYGTKPYFGLYFFSNDRVAQDSMHVPMHTSHWMEDVVPDSPSLEAFTDCLYRFTQSECSIAVCHILRHITTSGLTIDHESTGCITWINLSTYIHTFTCIIIYIPCTTTTYQKNKQTIQNILQ